MGVRAVLRNFDRYSEVNAHDSIVSILAIRSQRRAGDEIGAEGRGLEPAVRGVRAGALEVVAERACARGPGPAEEPALDPRKI